MSESRTATLAQTLGLRDVVLYFITAGVNLQWLATAAAAGPSSLVVWIIGAFAMFLPLGVCTVFLAARYPEQGGLYVWTKHAFGPFAGFVTGWTYWTCNLPYFPGVLYFAAGSSLYLFGASPAEPLVGTPFFYIAFAVGGLAFATALNVYGLEIGKWLNNVGAYARGLSIALLIVIGSVAWLRFGSATEINWHTLRPSLSLQDLIFWAALAFAWGGPESASFMGGEIRDARRTIPRALALAAPMIMAMYLAGTVSVLVAVPSSDTSALNGVMEAISHASVRLGLGFLAPIAAILIVLTCLGSAGAWIGSVARIPFVAGIDNFLPKAFGRLHPRYGSPAAALIVQAVIAMLLAVLGQAGTSVKGAYDVLISLMVIAQMIPFLFLFAAAIRLSGGAAQPGDLKVPGGRVTIVLAALLGLFTTAASIVLSVVTRPDDPDKVMSVIKVIGMTSVMLLAGILVYALGTARARRAALQGAA